MAVADDQHIAEIFRQKATLCKPGTKTLGANLAHNDKSFADAYDFQDNRREAQCNGFD
jgi:hypothetical protein